MLWNIALLSPPFNTLSYSIPVYFSDLKFSPCQRVCVPLGKSVRPGILLNTSEQENLSYSIKPILWPLEKEALINPEYMELILDLSKRQLKNPGEILASILPTGLRSSNLSLQVQDPHFPKPIKIKELLALKTTSFEHLAELWKRDRVFLNKNKSTAQEEYICISKNPPWNLRPRAFRKIEIMDYLWRKGARTQKEIVKEFGKNSLKVLKSLETMGLVSRKKELYSGGEKFRKQASLEDFVLSQEQKEITRSLSAELKEFSGKVRLLHGVTGSGKTLIYFYLARQCLELKRSVQILAPEVALAWQLYREAQKYLGEWDSILYHGYQTPRQREDIFSKLATEQAPCIVIGTRSAIFLPRTDWGLIVLDEEQDASFKQEERFQYQAKEVAFFWVQKYGTMLVLSSATPDVKTFYFATNDYFSLFSLCNRVGESELPEVELVNLHKDPQVEGNFSCRARDELLNCLSRGEQAILLLNRRGYSPLVYCTACGNVINCEYCHVGMTYHKSLGRVVCHYCGLSKPFPLPCPECGSHRFVPLSQGTEQVQEFLSSFLDPQTGVLRLDRDNTQKQGSMEEILESFSAGRAQVLVGTQMCSKGHHFPNVTLVLVLDGDVGLNLPDYRATEKTFQLLTQVSGRAGRAEKPGKVLIQTHNPNHYCWQYIINNDYQGFFEQEIQRRRRYNYPPFTKLALLRMNYPAGWAKGTEYIQEVTQKIRKKSQNSRVQVLGPAPAPLRQLRGRLRYQCLLKSPEWREIRSLCAEFLYKYAKNPKFKISLDLDPVQML